MYTPLRELRGTRTRMRLEPLSDISPKFKAGKWPGDGHQRVSMAVRGVSCCLGYTIGSSEKEVGSEWDDGSTVRVIKECNST